MSGSNQVARHLGSLLDVPPPHHGGRDFHGDAQVALRNDQQTHLQKQQQRSWVAWGGKCAC